MLKVMEYLLKLDYECSTLRKAKLVILLKNILLLFRQVRQIYVTIYKYSRPTNVFALLSMLRYISFQQLIKKCNYYVSHSVFAQTHIYIFLLTDSGMKADHHFFKMFKKSEQDTATEYKTHLQSC